MSAPQTARAVVVVRGGGGRPMARRHIANGLGAADYPGAASRFPRRRRGNRVIRRRSSPRWGRVDGLVFFFFTQSADVVVAAGFSSFFFFFKRFTPPSRRPLINANVYEDAPTSAGIVRLARTAGRLDGKKYTGS